MNIAADVTTEMTVNDSVLHLASQIESFQQIAGKTWRVYTLSPMTTFLYENRRALSKALEAYINATSTSLVFVASETRVMFHQIKATNDLVADNAPTGQLMAVLIACRDNKGLMKRSISVFSSFGAKRILAPQTPLHESPSQLVLDQLDRNTAPYRIVLQRGHSILNNRLLNFLEHECGGASAPLHLPPYQLTSFFAPFLHASFRGIELFYAMPKRVADTGLEELSVLVKHETFSALHAAASPANGETDSIEHAQKTLELLRTHLQGTLHIDVAQLKLVRASAGPLSLGCDGRLKIDGRRENMKKVLALLAEWASSPHATLETNAEPDNEISSISSITTN